MPACTYPTRAEGVKVRAADAGVADLDVDIVVLVERPDLVLREVLPDHIALCGLGVQAHPALEGVVLRCHLVEGLVCCGCEGCCNC